eukprot:TRINITY_DN788_c0_g1_i1.p1 TRINITY_DN788_c0_g1~~TRINITY_DN788_c0_g1_i1.p1  ORF type:complete len:270 (+),score=43.94 TRINITY_DN788_c0_g1_i1:73-882(+)
MKAVLFCLSILFVVAYAVNFKSLQKQYKDAPPIINLGNYTKGPGQDFTTSSWFNTSVWTNVFNTNNGNNFWFSKTKEWGLLISSNQQAGWPQSGFMQTYSSDCSTGFGYGVYHFTAAIPSSNEKQGYGINLILWNADGSWIDAKNGNTISEVDILEANDNQGFSTLHYYDANSGNHNGQLFHAVLDPTTGKNLDLTQWHDYDFLWEDGLMALYIDSHLLYSISGEQVPKDKAHGGCNKTFGAQVVIQVTLEPLPTVQLMLQEMWFYTPK